MILMRTDGNKRFRKYVNTIDSEVTLKFFPKFVHCNNKCSKAGFSLLEILIALAILVVGVASVVNMFPVGLHAAKRGADFTSAGILAQEKMAEVMYLGYDNLSSIEGINTGTTISFPSPDEQYGYRIYDVDPTGIANLKKITLAVYRNDRGTERNEIFITYIADRD